MIVVDFTTAYTISAYHHWCCEFESRSGRDAQHYVIKFVSDLRQVGGFLRVLRFPSPISIEVNHKPWFWGKFLNLNLNHVIYILCCITVKNSCIIWQVNAVSGTWLELSVDSGQGFFLCDYILTPSEQFFKYIMTNTNYFLI